MKGAGRPPIRPGSFELGGLFAAAQFSDENDFLEPTLSVPLLSSNLPLNPEGERVPIKENVIFLPCAYWLSCTPSKFNCSFTKSPFQVHDTSSSVSLPPPMASPPTNVPALQGSRPRPPPEAMPTHRAPLSLPQGQSCDYCDAQDPDKAHPASHAVDGTERWWQSPPLSAGSHYNEVNVTLDLGLLFHVAYVLIKFANSPRPDLWVLERSTDFGRTYLPWQYFAHSESDCLEQFGKDVHTPITRDDDVICTTEYSRIVPLENGEVVVSLVNGRPGARNFTLSPTLKEFTKATNIRLRFLRTNTLLGHLISKAQRDPTVTRRYYYSIKDISIGGRCVCNGHAEACGAQNPDNLYQCECQHNTCGESCERCCPGYHQKAWQPAEVGHTNACEPCNCHGHSTACYYDPEVELRRESLNVHGLYEGGGVCINCQHNTAGVNCEKCAHSYYRPDGVPVESPHGCIRIPIYQTPTPGPEAPEAGHIQACQCHGVGVLDGRCHQETGHCLCQRGFRGSTCEECEVGHFQYPLCQQCECDPAGVIPEICDFWGKCLCRSGVGGTHCDTCLLGFHSFPSCQGSDAECDPVGTIDSQSGYCRCQLYVEGPTCSLCKPLYWNLAEENLEGCSECQCHSAGVLSGVGECQQKDGECYCKANVCGDACDTCEDGYFGLENGNYFGCQGCQCAVGGSLSPVCQEPSGACRCRAHIEGPACQRPESTYYFPDLHHMKFEAEDGTTPDGREVRFGFNPLEFPAFSWRGYVQMSPVQNEVKITLKVEKSSLHLFLVILRYLNPGMETVLGRVTAYPSLSGGGDVQSKEVIFSPTEEPSFVTIPGSGYAEPFSLSPGPWIICVMAEGVLLDYLVLIPSEYYEAPILQRRVTQPCAHSGPAEENCLLYQHLPVDRFGCLFACESTNFLVAGEPRKLVLRQSTPELPAMVDISGREVELQLRLSVPQAGLYVVILEYANEDNQLYPVDMVVNDPGSASAGRVNVYSCRYSFPCRSVVVDDLGRIAVFKLLEDAKVHLRASVAHFLLHKICFVPAEEFSTEYVKPSVHCVASYRPFVNQSVSCIPSAHHTPPGTLLLEARRGGDRPLTPQELPPSAQPILGATLKSPQSQMTLRGRVPRLGRYVFVVHFYQPDHPTFPAHVAVDAGRLWTGSFSAAFCPHVFGCRDQVMADGHVELDLQEPEVSVTVGVPDGKSLVLVHVLAVPAESYSYHLLREKPVDKAVDFINSCGGNGFYIDPSTASGFCWDSAISLVASYHDGAVPCQCHPAGTTDLECNPRGGQCPCRPNVIGRQCTRCQTGYYGFPSCKACNCGRRLCDEMTGRCLCPPGTVRPGCETCQPNSFSYHPQAGCLACNCSLAGTSESAAADCDGSSGQCRCKAGVEGRRCDRCAPGFSGFPDCAPCNCHHGGTEPAVCDPRTGACLCKENVEGVECNVCRKGSFYLDPKNPKGCISCFCFGANVPCQSSEKRRTKFVDMMGWRLKLADQADIPTTFNPGSSSVVADVQELPASAHSVYWMAPPSYLGDKVSSYGGFLTYQVKSFGLPSEGMVPLEKRPDVLLTGQQMKIAYLDPSHPLPDRRYYGRVQLLEDNFRHASGNARVSRAELMTILSRLDGLHIRGLYFAETQRLSLGEVGLEEASSSGSGSKAPQVERCFCPSGSAGDSCQDCSPGYYRENRGSPTGPCTRCDCHGHTLRCQDGSGVCINCQHNTAGDHCERCKDGYFGNARQGSCNICPCPHTNSFATGCEMNDGNIRCFCKPGYTGTQCESCAPGYFGNPLKYGGSCQPCNCYSNGQPITCDPLTGDCSSQEPQDSGPEGDCDDCDSCVMTLLQDLNVLREEARWIKAELQNFQESAKELERLKQMEAQVKAMQNELSKYQTATSRRGLKIDALQKDLINLNRDFSTLQEKAKVNSRKAQTFHSTMAQANEHLKALDVKIKTLSRDIHVFLNQISEVDVGGGGLPPRDFSRQLEDAKKRVMEMQTRNIQEQLKKAEAEKREAQVLLERLRAGLGNHRPEDHRTAQTIRASLDEYEAQISDLEKALQEASEHTKKADGLNRENERALANIEKRVKEANSVQNQMNHVLTGAETSLRQTGSVLRLVEGSQEEYEKLSVQVNEVRIDLRAKVKDLSGAASHRLLVEQAEARAQSLQNLAKQLEEIKRNTSGDELVRCAVDAAMAYENIINAVKAAEDAANKAEKASDAALSIVKKEDLPGRAKTLSTESDKLLAKAKGAREMIQQEIGPGLSGLKSSLEKVSTLKDGLETNLASVQRDLRRINRDDVEQMIAAARAEARRAQERTDGVLNDLDPIQKDVERLKETYRSNQTENFNQALIDARFSVERLTNKLPGIFSKIESINQQLVPRGNISVNVDRIRELIQQARDAANKVAVPMRFNGHSGVEVRPPSDLGDLKGYMSLSLFLQKPKSRVDGEDNDMFVMFLGSRNISKDYMGMAVRDGKLICVYKLGNQAVEIQAKQSMTESDPEEAIMDRVKFQRIYQFAKLSYTPKATNNGPQHPEFNDKKGKSDHVLFDLDPDDVVFYVGGYPSDFKPPGRLNAPRYKGCLELDDLNENVLSLYNFRRTFNLNTTEVEPCRRSKEESDKNFFEGVGYARVPNQLGKQHGDFDQVIQTTVDEGLLFFAANQSSYISLNVENGYLVLRYKLDSGPPKEARNREPISDGVDKRVRLVIVKAQHLIRVTVKELSIEVKNVNLDFSTYYLGGIPILLRERYNISTPAFRGCMKTLKNNGKIINLNDTVGVTKKCSEDWQLVRSAFFRRGNLKVSSSGFPFPNNFQTSFGFHTVHPEGLLLSHQARENRLLVYLDHGHVKLTTKDSTTPLVSSRKYADGLLHYVSVIKDDSGLKLLIDERDESFHEETSISSPSTKQSILIGGSDFEGCITNVFIERLSQSPEVQNLINHTGRSDVSLGGCRMNTPPLPLLLEGPLRRNNPMASSIQWLQGDMPTDTLMETRGRPHPYSCLQPTRPQEERGAWRFGASPASHLWFSLLPAGQKDRSQFALELRTTSLDGLVFFMGTKRSSEALYLSKGRLVLFLKTGKRPFQLKSRDRFSDGQWHMVAFGHDGNKGHLVIDGLSAREGRLAGNSTLGPHTSFYLGSPPLLKMKHLPRHSFVGCLRNFQVDGRPVVAPAQNSGVSPCLEGPLEPGIYFSPGAGHLALDPPSIPGGKAFQVELSMRPRSLHGVLLHTGSQAGWRLSLYLRDGEVIVTAGNGSEEFSTSVSPKQALCDGRWHSVAVTLEQSVLHLQLDAHSNKVTVPWASLPSGPGQLLYLGGIPVHLNPPSLSVSDQYLGCLRDIAVNGAPASVPAASRIRGEVSLMGCPAH
ncbi:laminin subunit alpha-3 [Tachyglossus aculeatus]|uniref:laminin subunit alpha-3 n=1 Tax=Tachyglossus aculeatus TaxID=9261 RepID=UPI0018F346C0|nr:laminin subunit alpha-3 [Tachyglossus aculeatus]